LILEEEEEVKNLSKIREPSLDIYKCSLHELIAILEKFEKIERYNNEAMILPKLDDAWIKSHIIGDTPCYSRV
jgi:hypothetical protein